MCFDLDSRPPISPITGGALDTERLIVRSGDGASVGAYLARAAVPSGAAILVLPDIRGLHPYYEELALRFAEAGVDALAVDYFGRTAGTSTADRAADFDFRSHASRTTYDGLTADVRAAAARLRGAGPDRVRALFTIGFCFGGRLSLLAGTLGLDLAGAVSFYGWPVGDFHAGMPAPVEAAPAMRSPLLAIFGGGDTGIPPEAVSAFERALGAAGVTAEVVVYPDAPHSFFDRKAADWAEASADAWARTLAFIRERTPAAPRSGS
jgi:carboxymethylenebutenolidase